jgi:hypothetical protein
MVSFNTSKLWTTQLWHQLYIHHALFVQSFIASLMLRNLNFQDGLSQFLLWSVSVEEVITLSGEGGGGGGVISFCWK